MEDKRIKVWQVDINESYWVDEDYNIFKTQEDFYEYHFDECHCTKDGYESWCEHTEEEYNLQEKEGIEITKAIYDDLEETIEYYRAKNI